MNSLPETVFLSLMMLAEQLINLWFVSAFAGKRLTWRVLPLLLLSLTVAMLQIPVLLWRLLYTCILLLYGPLYLRSEWQTALLAALLSVEIMQLCYGVFNPLYQMLCASFYPRYPLLISGLIFYGGSLLSILLAFLCDWLIVRFLIPPEGIPLGSVLLTLTPLLLIFSVGSYVSDSFYGNSTVIDPALPVFPHIQMFLIQFFGLASIFCILYTCRRLTGYFSMREKITALTQQSRFQQQYVAEAQERSAAAAALRHDLRNHLLVLRGLLDSGEYRRAVEYLGQLDGAAQPLSNPFHTGHPVLDILLENKAALAQQKGIRFTAALSVPSPCAVDDLDFCILLANALDNALHACETLESGFIHVSNRLQGDFLLIEVENSTDKTGFRAGTGLSNIQWTVEKYGGSTALSMDGHTACLSILLDISQHPQDISQQSDCTPKTQRLQ